jgi:L-2-hydroxyglutarate oxidase LhgO
MFKIYENARKNNISVEIMSKKQAYNLEPMVKGYGDLVLYSPTTGVGNNL